MMCFASKKNHYPFVFIFFFSQLAACSTGHPQNEPQVGTLVFPLSGTAASGRRYTLVDANFTITGQTELHISSNDYLDEDEIDIELLAGEYTIQLNDGWSLVATNDLGEVEAQQAVLTSRNPQSFIIRSQETTNITIKFRVGEDNVELCTGELSISIEVEEKGSCTCEEGLVLWNTLGSEEELENSSIGPDGERVSHPTDENAWSAVFDEGFFGGGIRRSRNRDVNTSNEFFHFGDDAVNHSGISIMRGCVEFWWKAVDFGDGITGNWFITSHSSSERADNGGPEHPFIQFAWNSWDYGEGYQRSVGATVGYSPGDNFMWAELENRFAASFESDRWYHLAVVWDVDGIPGDPDGHPLAIYRDGEKWSAVIVSNTLTLSDDHYVPCFWFPGTRPSNYASGGSFYYNLWGTYDNVKAWNYAKTDFSDRFME